RHPPTPPPTPPPPPPPPPNGARAPGAPPRRSGCRVRPGSDREPARSLLLVTPPPGTNFGSENSLETLPSPPRVLLAPLYRSFPSARLPIRCVSSQSAKSDAERPEHPLCE